jgi:hypothetical protein
MLAHLSAKRIGLLALVLLLALSSVALAASVTPTLIPGADNTNKTCAVVMPGTTELKVDPVPNGSYSQTDGTLTVQIVKPSTLAGSPYSFDWTSNITVLGVIVKDGVDGANWYDYRPSGSTGDTYLTTPNDGAKGISHVSFCYVPAVDYERLVVAKTAVTSFTRTHDWSIEKSVATEKGYEHDGYPKVWLYIGGAGDETATWTVDVTYTGYTDSDFNISGDITIENTGTLDAVITDIADVLGGAPITVDCGVDVFFPYTLPVGGALTCTYDEDGYVEGDNVATVTTERDAYSDTVPVIWGDPTTEINKTVTVKDISDIFGEVELGTVTAPDGAQFTYTKNFAWANYGKDGCGDYGYSNTAMIVETGQSDWALLKVNVQCYVYETAYAMGDPAMCFIPTFSNWGWTNAIGPGTYEWPLWAAAGQCDTSKGTLVGSVSVVYGADGYVTVAYNVAPPYLIEETHVYANYGLWPSVRKRPTVAPGAYYNASPFDGTPVYVIAHAVIGIPDPNFGP